jgi:hypothetical protein
MRAGDSISEEKPGCDAEEMTDEMRDERMRSLRRTSFSLALRRFFWPSSCSAHSFVLAVSWVDVMI